MLELPQDSTKFLQWMRYIPYSLQQCFPFVVEVATLLSVSWNDMTDTFTLLSMEIFLCSSDFSSNMSWTLSFIMPSIGIRCWGCSPPMIDPWGYNTSTTFAIFDASIERKMKHHFGTLLLSLFDGGLHPLLNLLILFTSLNVAMLLFLGVYLPCPTVQRPTKIDQYNLG